MDFYIKLNGRIHQIMFFCDKKEETMVHLFCECEKVSSIWIALLDLLLQNYDPNFTFYQF